MSTPRKFRLFIVLLSVFSVGSLVVGGCEKKKPTPEEPAAAAVEEDTPENAETRCFEGDPEACDELGH